MLRLALAVGLSLLIVFALWSPGTGGPPLFPHDDKVMHFLGFAGLGCAWSRVCAGVFRTGAALAMFAAITEVGQGYVPWPRTPDVADFAFDILGVALGLAIGQRLARRKRSDAPARRPRAEK